MASRVSTCARERGWSRRASTGSRLPEGDTIHRTAAALDRALAGKELVRFETPRLRVAPFPSGTIVEGAKAVGKHCLIHFDDGRPLRTHMRMDGSWHLYRPDERWRRSRSAMRAV